MIAGLRGLGQPSAFTEEALQAKLAELARVRMEIASTEAEIQAVRTGRPVRPSVAPGPGRIQVTAPPAPALPGGSIELPLIGRVPTLAVAGAAAAALLFARRRK